MELSLERIRVGWRNHDSGYRKATRLHEDGLASQPIPESDVREHTEPPEVPSKGSALHRGDLPERQDLHRDESEELEVKTSLREAVLEDVLHTERGERQHRGNDHDERQSRGHLIRAREVVAAIGLA